MVVCSEGVVLHPLAWVDYIRLKMTQANRKADLDPTSTGYLSVRDSAKHLGVCDATIYRLIAAGKLPAIRVGRAIRVPEAILVRWIESSLIETTSSSSSEDDDGTA